MRNDEFYWACGCALDRDLQPDDDADWPPVRRLRQQYFTRPRVPVPRNGSRA